MCRLEILRQRMASPPEFYESVRQASYRVDYRQVNQAFSGALQCPLPLRQYPSSPSNSPRDPPIAAASSPLKHERKSPIPSGHETAAGTLLPKENVPKKKQSIVSIDENSPWDGKFLLSLDGGGVRGLSSLLFLQIIMQEVGRLEQTRFEHAKGSAYSPLFDASASESSPGLDEDRKPSANYLPCHYFDYIAGTSTGGLVAIMLGRLRMSVDQCIDEYVELSKSVFEKPSSRIQRVLRKYDSGRRTERLKARFEKLASQFDPQKHNRNSDQTPRDAERLFARSDAIGTMKITTSPKMARIARNPSARENFAIWEVARATSAASSFFKPIALKDELYYDGGTLNNPTLQLLNEVTHLGKGSRKVVDTLLSIGNGNSREKRRKLSAPKSALLEGRTSYSNYVHKRVTMESKLQGSNYYRLEVDEMLSTVRLDEWKPKDSGKFTLERIKKATYEYLQQANVKSLCATLAEQLAEKRILRSQTMRWECFATGTRYRCPLPECSKRRDTIYLHRNALKDHLRIEHHMAPPDSNHYEEIQTLIEKGRTDSDSSNDSS
ncbi:uncharacterized protein KY384_005206 [Bacidia gigantensis]|uniref:uncharacterized protein n=1 Tax=Bacidia gigantensis TaxID=2732470 RepID=UPI001D054BC9|nr:uncharacterized protein KY384_005206 [Bacidia gigantensis]KAG8529725.1 hypothetical protein KY384_005206 [Bacidia gigantensis]